MKFIRNLIVILGFILLILVGGAYLLPREVTVERDTVINAPPSAVYAVVSDLRRFNDWSPWHARDPDTTYAFEGPEEGVGQRMVWQSEKMGSGAQEIAALEENRRVDVTLDFGDDGTANSSFILDEVDEGTHITWHFHTDLGWDPTARWMGLMFDRWVGNDYEEGLANLKTLFETHNDETLGEEEAIEAEEARRAGPDFIDISEVEIDARPILAKSVTTDPRDPDQMQADYSRAYAALAEFAEEHGLEIAGAPLAINVSHDAETYVFHAALPLTAMPEDELNGEGDIWLGWTPGGTAVRAVHTGPYSDLDGGFYAAMKDWMADHGLRPGMHSWEVYVVNPGDTDDPAEYVTHVFYLAEPAEPYGEVDVTTPVDDEDY
jgi:effector-binding domain-containing protein/uncharacterized protein YndB with AHSA1/START domain